MGMAVTAEFRAQVVNRDEQDVGLSIGGCDIRTKDEHQSEENWYEAIHGPTPLYLVSPELHAIRGPLYAVLFPRILNQLPDFSRDVRLGDAIEYTAKYRLFSIGNDAVPEGDVEQGINFFHIESTVIGEQGERGVGQLD